MLKIQPARMPNNWKGLKSVDGQFADKPTCR